MKKICPTDPRSKAAKLWRRDHWPKGRSKAERAYRAFLLNDLPCDFTQRIAEIRRRSSER
jgi:hypothetical protein